MAAVAKDIRNVNDRQTKTARLRRTYSIGPGLFEHCLAHAIAKCECDILQPQPGLASTFTTGVTQASSYADLRRSDTLLPAVTRSLFLWKDEELGEYHLTALNVAKEEIFLDLPLSGLVQGDLTYIKKTEFWHEVTVCGESGKSRMLVFNLVSSPETKNFNNRLQQVIDEISADRKSTADLTQNNVFESSIVQASQPVAVIKSSKPMASASVPTPRHLGSEVPSLAAGDLSSGLPVARVQDKLPSSVAKQVSEELAAAIQAGNIRKAQELATLLAQGHTKVDVSFDANTHEKQAKEQEISVTVHVEDRESAGLVLTDVKVRPSDTILDLKRSFLGKYGFPCEVQKWIIGNRICKDEETLSRCDIHTSGHTLYLYLLSARAANITREDFRRQSQGQAAGGRQRAISHSKSDYESMRMPMASQGPPAMVQGQGSIQPSGQGQGPFPGSAARQQSHLSASSSASSLAAGSLGMADLNGTLQSSSGQNSAEATPTNRTAEVAQGQGLSEIGAEELMAAGGGDRPSTSAPKGPPRPPRQPQQTQPEASLGWQCGTCTLINQPTRPGCEACGSPRPRDYQIPSSYVVSEEERLRLEREQQLEALMQEASGHRWRQGQEQGGATTAGAQLPFPTNNDQPLTSEQLDLILRFNDAIQQHLSESGGQGTVAGGGGMRRGVDDQLGPRHPVQNADLGEEEERNQRERNYQQLLQAESGDLVPNTHSFDCPICFDEVQPGEGVVLRECLHMFCKSCLMEAIRLTEEAELKCPFQDDHYSCSASLQEREIRALSSDQIYERYLRRSLDVAESQARNSYHCKTADCRGWCIYEDLVNFFRCPVCRHENCLTCRAIHEGMNCKQYQEDLKIRAANDQAAKQTQAMLQDMLEKGEAMHCPSCEVVVQKKDGCDWIRCSICKTEICWVTKGPRWGPGGEGDTSGGCRCRLGGKRCHPKCTNCH